MASTTSIGRLLAACALSLALAACTTVGPGGGDDTAQPTGQPAPPSDPLTGNAPPSGDNPPAGTRHACDLLTDAEIRQVTGLDVAQKGPTGLLPVLDTQCDYELGESAVLAPASLTLAYKAPGGRGFYETYFEPFIGDGTELLTEPLEGVGDKGATGPGGVVMAVKGDALVDLQLLGIGENRDQIALEVMRLVLSKLP